MIGFIFKLDPAPHPIGDKPLVQTEMILGRSGAWVKTELLLTCDTLWADVRGPVAGYEFQVAFIVSLRPDLLGPREFPGIEKR
jgi:hypothetical protein